MIKKILSSLLIFGIGFTPQIGEAVSYHTNRISFQPAIAGSETEDISGIQKAAYKALPAVVSIDRYKDAPEYMIEVTENADVGGFDLNVIQVGVSKKRVSSGTGFFVRPDGYLVTNKHVVDDSDATYIVDTGSIERAAEVIYIDPTYDLAVLKIEGEGYPSISISDSSEAKVGEEVASVGNALGKFVDTISSGEILSLSETVSARDGRTVEILDDVIVTNARLYPGDSGGPLLNSDGEAIGVNVAIVAGTDISFSIPGDATKEVLRKAGIEI